MTYTELLHGRGMKVGDLVVCDYRTPTPHQWWIHPFWIGVLEAVGTDPKQWTGHNSEESYCVQCCTVKVRYLGGGDGSTGFTQHDSLGNLTQVHTELTGPLHTSPWFSSDELGQRALYDFACKLGMGDRYSLRGIKAHVAYLSAREGTCAYCQNIEAMTGVYNCPIHSATEVR
jgi:hypothetical protein